jgi:hypothetical protein
MRVNAANRFCNSNGPVSSAGTVTGDGAQLHASDSTSTSGVQ